MSGRRLFDSLDISTIATGFALVLAGVCAIASATLDPSGGSQLWKTQLVWVAVSTIAAVVVVRVDYHVWAEIALAMHGVVLLLLVAVLFFGREVGGNRSWLVLGPFRLQPSEFAKWTTCLVLAVYLARKVHGSVKLRDMIGLGLLAGSPFALIAMQPDHGTALIFLPLYLAAVFMGGVRWKVIMVIVLVGVLLLPLVWFVLLEGYQKERILTTFDPGRDPSGYGYQVRQSQIAIGSGGIVGQGLFQGTQSQLNFLPAQHTDFVLAVLAEDLGFVGALGVLGLFYLLFYRGFVAARSSQDRLGTFICMLVVAWLAGQMAVNVGMVLGRLPTIGVPLPLMSYGGSALVASVSAVALIVNVRTRRFVN